MAPCEGGFSGEAMLEPDDIDDSLVRTVSDDFVGPGWWIASDGKWYAPELHRDARFGSRFPVPGRRHRGRRA